MSQLLTQCPFCQTTFKVSDAQLQAANGVVRCGACLEVFIATQHRVILKDKPRPVVEEAPRDDDAAADLSWEVIDDEPPAAEPGADSDDAFTSWEEEEDYRRTEARAWFPGAEEIDATDDEEPWDDGDVADTTPEDDDDDLPPEDEALDEAEDEPEDDDTDNSPDAVAERPAYSGQLNPAGYSMTQFSVESLLSGIFGLGGNDRTKGAQDADAGEGIAHEDQDAIATPAPPEPVARTAVIVRDKGDRIPTLEPDVVASEDIPASGPATQSLNWFQSLRKTLRDNRTRRAAEEDTDEKAEIHRRLSALRADDSLDPVDSTHLEALAAEPVELLASGPRWTRLQRHGLAAASAGLLLALVMQYFWFNLDSLVLARRMPAVTGLLCQLRTCPDRNAIDLSTIVTEELVVRSHPEQDGALLVDFIFRNDNSREQRFPLVELNFTNNAGDVVANRVFTTAEYLPPEMQLFTYMPAHSSIQASLALVDPGNEATGYSLIFRNP